MNNKLYWKSTKIYKIYKNKKWVGIDTVPNIKNSGKIKKIVVENAENFGGSSAGTAEKEKTEWFDADGELDDDETAMLKRLYLEKTGMVQAGRDT